MSLSEQWQSTVLQARDEWQSNKRLQLITLVSVLLFGVWCIVQLESFRLNSEKDAKAAFEKLQDISQTAKEERWPDRAEQSKAALEVIRQQLWHAGSEGEAQATLRDWLEQQARNNKLVIDRMTVDLGSAPQNVTARPVRAELEGRYEVGVWQNFMLALSEHSPLVLVEYEEINFGNPRKTLYKISVMAWFELSVGQGRS